MGVFKRIALFVFGLAGLLALAALSLPWVGPWTVSAEALLHNYYYFNTLACLVVICAFGLLVCLLRALFTRNRKVVQVSREGADTITVTRDAIANQATHVIEEDGRFHARRVIVDAKVGGRVSVYARVQPVQTVDVVDEGHELHERLMEGLAIVCGDSVDKVQIEFTSAAEYVSAPDEPEFADESPETPAVPEHLALTEVREESEGELESTASGITVPMGHAPVVPAAGLEAEEE